MIRFFILNIGGRTYSGHYLAENKFWTLMTMSKVVAYYFYLLFIPKLSSQPDYENYFKLATSFLEPGVVISMTFLLLLAVISFLTFKKNKIITFVIAWFFVTLLPVSNIIPMKNIMAERHLYIPSFAVCAFIPVILNKIFSKNAKLYSFSLILLLVIYGTFTFKRNSDWKNELTLWSRALNNFPGSGKALNGIGVAYAEEKQFDKALPYFLRYKMLSPQNIDNLNNLGNIYMEKHDYDLAIGVFSDIIKLNPNDVGAYGKIGIIYSSKNDFNNALKYFSKVVLLNPKNAMNYTRIGTAYFNKGQIETSILYYKKAIEIHPDFDAYYNLGAAYATKNAFVQAIGYYNQAIEINSNDAQCHIDLGHIYFSLKEYEKAKKEFGKALAIDPANRDANAFFNILNSK